jgi:hypothetical protein
MRLRPLCWETGVELWFSVFYPGAQTFSSVAPNKRDKRYLLGKQQLKLDEPDFNFDIAGDGMASSGISFTGEQP